MGTFKIRIKSKCLRLSDFLALAIDNLISDYLQQYVDFSLSALKHAIIGIDNLHQIIRNQRLGSKFLLLENIPTFRESHC